MVTSPNCAVVVTPARETGYSESDKKEWSEFSQLERGITEIGKDSSSFLFD